MASSSTYVESPDSGEDLLCARCAAVDFNAALSSEEEAILINDLGPTEEWSISSCKLCELLASLIMRGDKVIDRCSLRTTNSRNIKAYAHLQFLKAFPPKMLLGVYSHRGTSLGHFIPQFGGIEPVRTLKIDSIDFSILKSWLDLCRTEHIRHCTYQLPETTIVQHLKMIDCYTRQIIPAKNAGYVTLSYVWGQADQDIEYSEHLPMKLPCTIEDAIQVTLGLGYQYLWIDRYCINQKHKEHAYSQMSQMDLIYQNSEVTIVAAAGKDPTYGLPGVRERNRRRQPQAQIGSTALISPLKTTDNLIEKSEWATRAWTYQEALLARRRLVFTDEQVYFQCHYMHRYEAHQSLPESRKSLAGKQIVEGILILGPPDRGVFPNRVDTGKNSICQRILEYSKRSLSRQSDKLNAFLGILRVFEMRGTYHCWGTPIFHHSMDQSPSGSTMGTSAGFVRGLCWTSLTSLFPPEAREPHLPSWSWTGWSGSVDFEDRTFDTLTPMAVIDVELCDGSVIDWEQFQQHYAEFNNPTKLSRYIHVQAPAIHVHHVLKKHLLYECVFKMNDGWFIRRYFNARSRDSLDTQSCKAFILAYRFTASRETSRIFIVFVTIIEDRFERFWGGWIASYNWTLLRPDHEVVYSDSLNTVNERYGADWHNSLALASEVFRIG